MRIRNILGKKSCALGVISFVMCSLAAYSHHHHLRDSDSTIISPIVNLLLIPVNFLNSLGGTQEPSAVPTMMSLGLNHVFEHEAVIVFYVLSVLFGAASLYFATKSARRHEFSIWYTNGAYASIYALCLLNVCIGAVVAVAVVTKINRVRRD